MIIIPKPQEIINGEGSFECAFGTYIVCGAEVELLPARLLKDCIARWAGLELPIVKGKARGGDIALELDDGLGKQEYRLEVQAEKVRVLGGSGAGLLYGVQTLCQMVEQNGALLPSVTVRDFPDIPKRGYYLDQARGRVLKLKELKDIVDRLCRYKINEFQLYVEHTYLFRDLSEMWRDTTPLTAEEIMELDDYCAERHIELVPSLSSFGHLYMLLSTKSHEELCELPEASSQPFSFIDRMQHHTVDVSNDRTLPLIEGMLEEYMALFRSDRFNLCADETFDLGKGKSARLAEEKGIHRIYVDYLKELCAFLTARGKKPMFWGDVIAGEPMLARELPEETVCLVWGYEPDQREDGSRSMAEAGVPQYLCPGVIGWNQWMNRIGDSYQNITRMCGYARKYQAIGVLNTDWGDMGHINHPEHSVPGMIYGAAFSWNGEEISRQELNRQISLLEYRDGSGRLAGLLEELSECCLFGWLEAVILYDLMVLGMPGVEADMDKLLEGRRLSPEIAGQAAEKLQALRRELKRTAVCMDSSRRCMMQELELTAEGMDIWNNVGLVLSQTDSHSPAHSPALAGRLENWFQAYKEIWRQIGKEGELGHVAEIVFWYADLLRGRERKNKR